MNAEERRRQVRHGQSLWTAPQDAPARPRTRMGAPRGDTSAPRSVSRGRSRAPRRFRLPARSSSRVEFRCRASPGELPIRFYRVLQGSGPSIGDMNRGRSRRLLINVALVAVLVAVGAGAYLTFAGGGGQRGRRGRLVTASVTRGNVRATVSASGTVVSPLTLASELRDGRHGAGRCWSRSGTT